MLLCGYQVVLQGKKKISTQMWNIKLFYWWSKIGSETFQINLNWENISPSKKILQKQIMFPLYYTNLIDVLLFNFVVEFYLWE